VNHELWKQVTNKQTGQLANWCGKLIEQLRDVTYSIYCKNRLFPGVRTYVMQLWHEQQDTALVSIWMNAESKNELKSLWRVFKPDIPGYKSARNTTAQRADSWFCDQLRGLFQRQWLHCIERSEWTGHWKRQLYMACIKIRLVSNHSRGHAEKNQEKFP
jgi:hypothetical protein